MHSSSPKKRGQSGNDAIRALALMFDRNIPPKIFEDLRIYQEWVEWGRPKPCSGNDLNAMCNW